jgi:hypothetical protein
MTRPSGLPAPASPEVDEGHGGVIDILQTGETSNLPAQVTISIDRKGFDRIEFPPPVPKDSGMTNRCR